MQWSSDYGGSAEIYVNGAPAATNIAQATQCAIMPGDRLTVNVFHTDTDHFGSCGVLLNGSVILRTDGSAGFQSLTWTADRAYDAGTQVMLYSSAWPGSSTTWFEGIEYSPAVPEPTTFVVWSVLGVVGIMVGWGRKRAA